MLFVSLMNIQAVLKRFTYGYLSPGKFWSHGMGLHKLQTDALTEAISEFECPKIIEFGSGRSTEFFSGLCVPFEMISFDHDERFCYSGQDPRISLRLVDLRQWDEETFESILLTGDFEATGSERIPKHNFRDQRVFYDLSSIAFTPPYDLALLDGPNGSGRLLGCAVLSRLVAVGSLIMLDDVHHFNFEEILGRHLEYEVVARVVNRRVHPLFGFSLVRVTKQKYDPASM